MKVLRNIIVGALCFAEPLPCLQPQASSLPDCLLLTPGFYLRAPGSVAFRLISATQTIEPDSILR